MAYYFFFSDHFGLRIRSPVIRKPFQSKSATTSVAACVFQPPRDFGVKHFTTTNRRLRLNRPPLLVWRWSKWCVSPNYNKNAKDAYGTGAGSAVLLVLLYAHPTPINRRLKTRHKSLFFGWLYCTQDIISAEKGANTRETCRLDRPQPLQSPKNPSVYVQTPRNVSLKMGFHLKRRQVGEGSYLEGALKSGYPLLCG